MHRSHVQSPDGGAAFLGAGAGLGDSHIVHFSLAESGFFNMQVSHVQSGPDAWAIGFAAFGFAGADKSKLKSSIGRDIALALIDSSTFDWGAVIVKVKEGSDPGESFSTRS